MFVYSVVVYVFSVWITCECLFLMVFVFIVLGGFVGLRLSFVLLLVHMSIALFILLVWFLFVWVLLVGWFDFCWYLDN